MTDLRTGKHVDGAHVADEDTSGDVEVVAAGRRAGVHAGAA